MNEWKEEEENNEEKEEREIARKKWTSEKFRKKQDLKKNPMSASVIFLKK